MPHKRAKRSVREQQRSQRKTDLPPSISTYDSNDVPKSVARVLNAEKVREEWRDKKRKIESGDGNAGGSKKRKTDEKRGGPAKHETGQAMKIMHGESLIEFNRRVEDNMRPLVRSAMKTSFSIAKGAKKTSMKEMEAVLNSKLEKGKLQDSTQTTAGKDAPSPDPVLSRKDTKTEFAKLPSSAPKRLNDVAQAPPEFKTLPRGAKKTGSGTVKESGNAKEGIVPLAQKQMMEIEREKAIQRYRAMKDARLNLRETI